MTDPLLIAGGGIGGLCAASVLARAGLPVRVLEQMEAFSEAGGGIQVGPNAMHLLRDWGLDELIAAYASVPEGIRLFDGLGGKLLTRVPLGREAEQRYGGPNIVIKRAHLQQCLLDVAWTQPGLEISTGFALAGYESGEDGVAAIDARGARVEGRALIGSDGLQSTVRARLHETRPETVAKTAWRTVVPAAEAPALFGENYTGVWMAPYCHLVHYPVGAGDAVDVLAIIEDTYNFEGWGAPGDPEDLLPHFDGWHERPLGFLEQLSDWTKWSLFSMDPLPAWGEGRVTLLGDAAHPIQPFLAQGSAMAIEDAAVLAQEIIASPDSPAEALRRYERRRMARTARVQRASHHLGQIYHVAGVPRWLRDAVLRWRTPASLLARYDWLYGFSPTAA